MAQFDLPLSDLRSYRPQVEVPEDLESFWTATVAQAREHPLGLRVEPVDNKLRVIDTYDVAFAGFGGQEVRAWLNVPAGATGPLPTVLQYLGYSDGRAFPHSFPTFAAAGYAHLVLDTRGQGWTAGGGSGTPDLVEDAGLSSAPGLLTLGITDPSRYYYRRVFVDALRLLEATGSCDLTDPARVVVTGRSQGGGITLAVAGLAPLVGLQLCGAAPDVPFLCHFRRAVEVTDERPYAEIAEYLSAWRDHANAAYQTLGYFDGVNLGALATAPALFSVGLRDAVCPPSTVFAAYNSYGTRAPADAKPPAKDIRVYAHNQHEGGEAYQVDAQLDWFATLLPQT